jgi:hypothetical protein
MNKITTEELEKIQKQQRELNRIINNVGVLETQKHGLLHELAVINKDVEDFKLELEKTYGSVNINMEDGSYEDIEKEEENV